MTSYTECQILMQHADYSLAEVTKQTSRDNVRSSMDDKKYQD